jgi:DNA-binding IclR family transcriptional regulator
MASVKDKVVPRVNSLIKAMRILDCFSTERPELNLTELSQQLKMPMSTLFNMIRTLKDSGYLIKIKNSQKYRLGFKLMELSYNLRASLSIIQLALPNMEELQSRTGEIVYLTTYINGRVLYLECLYPSKRSISYSVYGKTNPMHSSGCGKSMLAYMPEKTVDAIIDQCGLPQITPNTITNKAKLKKALAEYRKLGYAVDNEENDHNVRCIAMPILDSNGFVAGALSISGPVMSMTDEKFPEYTKLLAVSCNYLSQYAQLFPAFQMS